MASSRIAREVWRFGKGHPRVAILGGVHGNELTGVEVVRALVERFSNTRGAAKPLRGELTLAIGNPDAVARNVRFIDHDLNRCFERAANCDASKSIEKSRAAEICHILEDLDVLIDIHGTGKPSQPFARLPGAVDSSNFNQCENMFLSFLPSNCNTVLWDPDYLIGSGKMSDEYALQTSAHQGSFICLEAGLTSDVTAVPNVAAAVDAMLVCAGMLEDEVLQKRLQRKWSHYAITEVFRLDERGFQWVNGHGQTNFDIVPAGQVYGQRGTSGPTLSAAEESFIVFPKVPSLWGLGQPLGWLARDISSSLRSCGD